MLYWPTAIVKEESGTICSMYSTTGSNSIKEAESYFDFLKKDYNAEILCSYIQDDDNNIVQISNYTRPYSYHIQEPESKESGKYYPYFLIKNIDGNVWSMFTIMGFRHLQYTKSTIDIYKQHDDVAVLLAYVIKDNNIVYFENNVDAFGHIRYNSQESEEPGTNCKKRRKIFESNEII